MTAAEDLEKEIRSKIQGEVCFDSGSRALYATDASNYRQVPMGVIFPKTREDVIESMRICREFQVPILPRGAGTSLAGQCCNVAVVFDYSKYLNQTLEIDPQQKTAWVEPGVILDDLKRKILPHGLTFGPDPATHNRCTFGGMIGNNACGVHSIQSGKTVDNIEELEVLTYSGDIFLTGAVSAEELSRITKVSDAKGKIYQQLKKLRDEYEEKIRTKFPKLPRRVSGYNLDQLLPENQFNVARSLVGTEGTCATILKAKLRLIPHLPGRVLVVLGYPDVYRAADVVPFILQFGPVGLEGLDEVYVRNMKKTGKNLREIEMLPEGNAWLFIEFAGANNSEAAERAQVLVNGFSGKLSASCIKMFSNAADQKSIWTIREASFGASVFVPGEKDTFSGFEDSAVPPEKLGPYLRDLQKLYDSFGYSAITYGHFGDGCIHTRISFDLKTEKGIETYRAFQSEAADLVLNYGGSLSGEHGDGQTWGEFLPRMYGNEIAEAFKQFKNIWDPDGKMNPRKVVNAYRSDENLKLKNYFVIPQSKLHFAYEEDGGNFARTTERCIGIGKCLKKDEGTMCPSYMVTGEEKHSTRGRAHLLHEMMRGEILPGGWKEESVKEALDLCLACKACKSECPVSVDMASYKAEFLAHYYENKSRPVSAFFFSRISEIAKFASFIPGSSALMKIPLLQFFMKKFFSIAPERNLPVFSKTPFRKLFAGSSNPHGQPILLWTDTFNNYFYPEIAQAAVYVLESLGYKILLLPKDQCCGRPYYDFGMLDQAKQRLQEIMIALAPFMKEKIPIIGLEPSCVSVFRDEMLQFFPHDPAAKAIADHTFLLSEWLAQESNLEKLPASQGKALVHGHCHQKAILGMQPVEKILQKIGFEYEVLDSGCCGMAGAFGFEKDHFEISKSLADRRLIPAIKNASSDTTIITDGFSCREQVLQFSGCRSLHLAELLKEVIEKDRTLLHN